MSPSSHWTLFIARPGRDRQHVIRDPQGEPRILFGEDDGTRINDRLARFFVESPNAGLNPEDPNPDEGWFVESQRDGDEQDPAILICDPDFEIRLEILDTGSLGEDQAGADNILPVRFMAQRPLRTSCQNPYYAKWYNKANESWSNCCVDLKPYLYPHPAASV